MNRLHTFPVLELYCICNVVGKCLIIFLAIMIKTARIKIKLILNVLLFCLATAYFLKLTKQDSMALPFIRLSVIGNSHTPLGAMSS